MRRLGGLLGVVLLAPWLGSCGSDSEGDGYHPFSASSLPDAIAAAYEQAGSVRMVSESGPLSFDMRVQFTTAHEVKLDLSVSYPRTIDIIAVHGRVYARMADSGKYTELPPDVGDRVLARFASISPDGLTQYLRDGMKSVDYVGPDEVLGETLYEYDVEMDPDFLAERWSAEHPGSEPPAVDAASYRLWLDADNNLTQTKTGLPGHETETQMMDWGEPVHIEAPPRSQVKPYTGQTV